MIPALENFEILQLLGTSSCSSCYKVRNVDTEEILVWKVLHVGNISGKRLRVLEKEAEELQSLQHDSITNFVKEVFDHDENKLYIISEYCSQGSVASLINSCRRSSTSIKEYWIWQVLYELSGALKACQAWLESASVLHFNIKPTSIFLDFGGSIKLGNVDLMKSVDSNQNEFLDSEGFFYISPEMLQGESYSIKSDMWSLGCLIYELCALSPPFSAHTLSELHNKVELGRYERIPSHFSDDLSRVLANLLSRDPVLRPSPVDIMTNSVVLAHVVESVSMDELSGPASDSWGGPRKHSKRQTREKVPPASPPDPEQVSKDIFRTEWLHRLEAIRQREAKVRDREAAVQERERAISRREYKVALLEKAVKDKLTRAELYLKRSRETKSSAQRRPPPVSTAIDESFSADPGDTSILPTIARLDLTQVPRPSGFPMAVDRGVHFNGAQLKPQEELIFPKNKKILKLPGYTGPPLIVDAPTSDNASSSGSSLNPQSPTVAHPDVELKVLFDDRPLAMEDHMRRVSTMASQLEALNLEMARIKNNVAQKFVRPQPPERIDSLGLETKHLDLARYRSDCKDFHRGCIGQSSSSTGSLHLNGTYQDLRGQNPFPASGQQAGLRSHGSSTLLTTSSTGSSRPSSVDLKDVGARNAKNSIISLMGPSGRQSANCQPVMLTTAKENPNKFRLSKKSVLSFKTASAIYSRNKKPLASEPNKIN